MESINDYSLKQKSEQEITQIKEEYLSKTKKCKKIICEHWFRGFCSFPPLICKYAHGIKDLDYTIAKERVPKLKEHIQSTEIYYLKYDKRNYQILLDYINTLKINNKLDEKHNFTLEQLNEQGKARTTIRTIMHEEITKEFMKFLFDNYGNKCFLSINFITKEFNLIKFPIKFAWILNSQYYFTKNVNNPPRLKNSFELVLPFPERELLIKQFTNFMIQILKNLKLNNICEVTQKMITAEYYKNCIFQLPPFHVFLDKVWLGDFDHFIQELEKSEEFKQFEINESVNNMKFLSTKIKKNSLETQIIHLIEEFWLQDCHKNIGFAKMKDFLLFQQKHFSKQEITDYFINIGAFTKYLKVILIQTNNYLCLLPNEAFIYNPKYLSNKPGLILKREYSTQCKKSHFELKEEQKFEDSLNYNKNDFIKFRDERIITVDNKESFIYAEHFLKNYSKLGIDLEGQLYEGGMIDLIQIGVKDNIERKIFIFDIYVLKQGNQQLYEQIKIYLKYLMENRSIIKIFHDCRKDSLALHLFMEICPVSIFDTACIHIFIEQLKIFIKNKNNHEINHIEDIIRKIEEIPWPGLNVILSSYKAMYGINSLKEQIKKKFGEEREYFLRRPIENEFLEYSAKDVEDLVDVYEKAEKMLSDIMANEFLIEGAFCNFILEKCSRSYVKEGCKAFFEYKEKK